MVGKERERKMCMKKKKNKNDKKKSDKGNRNGQSWFLLSIDPSPKLFFSYPSRYSLVRFLFFSWSPWASSKQGDSTSTSSYGHQCHPSKSLHLSSRYSHLIVCKFHHWPKQGQKVDQTEDGRQERDFLAISRKPYDRECLSLALIAHIANDSSSLICFLSLYWTVFLTMKKATAIKEDHQKEMENVDRVWKNKPHLPSRKTTRKR